MTIIYFILMIGILISVHEAGHMFMAKAFNIYVREFAIGFGPKIFSKKGKETTYTIRAIPLGGFTAMVESEAENVASEDNPMVIEESRTFYGAKGWKRILVLLAGPAMNLIMAFMIGIAIFQINGYVMVYPEPYINSVMEDSPAQKAGMQAGDLIVRIDYADDNSHIIPKDFYDVILNGQIHSGAETYTVSRDGQQLVFTVEPVYNQESQSDLIGITSGQLVEKKLNFFTAIPEGIDYGMTLIKTTITSIVMLFKGAIGLDSMSGMVGMYSYTQEAVSYGFTSFLSLCASISVSLGIMNLLPLSVLDGGRTLLTLVEMAIGHRLNEKLETAILLAGWLLIMGLFVVVTISDILKLIH